MRVVISIAEHEQELAVRWLDWVCELGGTDGHSLWIIPSGKVNMAGLLPKAHQAFVGHVNILRDEEQETSDWQVTEAMRSAAGPNSSFRQVAWDAYMNRRGPYFWCELDCIPLRRDWIDKLEAEYKSCGKPFMGANVQIESVPEHMSGNAIYPTNIPEVAPTLVKRTDWIPKGQERAFELAFDIAGAREVLPLAHFTNLIQHKFRFKGFESRYEFDAVIDKNAVVFHSDKKGTIFKYLRENLSGVVVKHEVVPDKGGSRDGNASVVASAQTDFPVIGVHLREGQWKPFIETSCPANPIQSDPHPPTEPSTSNAYPMVSVEGTEARYRLVDGKFVQVHSHTSTSGSDLESVIKQNAVIKNGFPAMSPPWENREDSERDVKMLCDTLSIFCKTAVFKGRVRAALREAKIIK